MQYTVKRGDSLTKIASEVLGEKKIWSKIAFVNHLRPPYKIFIGQQLKLPQSSDWHSNQQRNVTPQANTFEKGNVNKGTNLMLARGFFFILADEVLPSGKIVRKVLQYPTNMQEMILANPEKFGMHPPNSFTKISIGEHALGANNSPYLSGSTLRKGAPNISGRPVYIDIARAKKAGVIIHSTEDIVVDLNRIQKFSPHLKTRIGRLKNVILTVEKEVLMQGDVPASAIKSGTSIKVTSGLRVVQFVGFAFTAYDMGMAAHESFKTKSPKPIVAESIRQVGGWGGAVTGVKIGGVAGAAIGIETGPGAIVTSTIGAIIFGAAGYFGADWVADFIDKN